VNSWGRSSQRPSDLGFDDEGYDLPPSSISSGTRWRATTRRAGEEKSGQKLLLKNAGDRAARRGAREEGEPGRTHRQADGAARRGSRCASVIWHDLEAEREAIERAIPASVVWGARISRAREADHRFCRRRDPGAGGQAGAGRAGLQFPAHCSWAIFLGIGFKFNDFIQAIHRMQRFLQTKQVRIDLIYTEAERAVRARSSDKWRQHDAQRG
jgi:hypothetical protein